MYEEVSIKIGYESLEGPGKVMGLAPYGKASEYYEKLKSFIKFDDRDYPFRFNIPGEWKIKGTHVYYRMPYRYIASALYPDAHVPWDPRGELHPDATNLAWAVQAVTEEVMLHLAKWTKENVSGDKLALAGDVAVNVKVNMVIHYAKIFNDIFIFPAANDAVAAYMALRHGDVELTLKPGARLNLTTLNPETIIAKPEGNHETTRTQGEAKQVSETAPTQVEANAPSFLVNNPWLDIIRRRS